jgi:hypothetical protein
MQTSTEIEAKIATLDEQLERIRERDLAINNAIGAALADGKDVAALRDERREIRETLEDLDATRPHLERRLEAARKAEAEAAIGGAMEERQRARDTATEMARGVFEHLKEALAAVAAIADAHEAVYALATGRCTKAAETAGHRPPPRDFILEGIAPGEWDTFRNGLTKTLESVPNEIRDLGRAA